MMIDKITLYREVLELEPGSRVFFPLAKLLADKEPAEAILTLKKGLSRHPDHVEARIFLIELLSANEGDADLDSELEIVSSILRNYPSFWKIWSAYLAHDSELHDAALAINFFGAGLSGRSVSWTDVITHGLNALLVEDGDETTPPLPSSADISRFTNSTGADFKGLSTKEGGSFEAEFPKDSLTEEAPHFSSEAVTGVSAESLDEFSASDINANVMPDVFGDTDALDASKAHQPEKAYESMISPEDGSAEIAGAGDVSIDFGDEEEGEEPFSLRTRTMADLLAEQGDFDGAIDIYNEILAVADENTRLLLADKLQELELLRQQSAVPGTPKKDVGVATDSDGGKLVSLLESLASRFENRAR